MKLLALQALPRLRRNSNIYKIARRNRYMHLNISDRKEEKGLEGKLYIPLQIGVAQNTQDDKNRKLDTFLLGKCR